MPEWGSTVFEWLVGLGLTTLVVGMFTLYSKIKDLHQWHDKEDEKGVKVWYHTSKDVEVTLGKMVEILDRLDRREERALLIQNETIKVMQEHTQAITKLVAVVEALTIITKNNQK